jgi:hypothetical protein
MPAEKEDETLDTAIAKKIFEKKEVDEPMKDNGPKGGPLTITKMFKRTQEAKMNQTHDPLPKTRLLETSAPANLTNKVTTAIPANSIMDRFKYVAKPSTVL